MTFLNYVSERGYVELSWRVKKVTKFIASKIKWKHGFLFFTALRGRGIRIIFSKPRSQITNYSYNCVRQIRDKKLFRSWNWNFGIIFQKTINNDNTFNHGVKHCFLQNLKKKMMTSKYPFVEGGVDVRVRVEL